MTINKDKLQAFTDDFWYDLLNDDFTPSEWLTDKYEIKEVEDAILTLLEYKQALMDSGKVEEY